MGAKVLIDVANELDHSKGMPPAVLASQERCLAEKLQAAFPNLKVVKALNTIGAPVMVDPQALAGGEHTVFVSGNDAQRQGDGHRALEVVRLDRRARPRRYLLGARAGDVHGDVDPALGRDEDRSC